VGKYVLDTFVASTCEHGNEPSSAVKGGFLD